MARVAKVGKATRSKRNRSEPLDPAMAGAEADAASFSLPISQARLSFDQSVHHRHFSDSSVITQQETDLSVAMCWQNDTGGAVCHSTGGVPCAAALHSRRELVAAVQYVLRKHHVVKAF